jgi:hypothetical protein
MPIYIKSKSTEKENRMDCMWNYWSCRYFQGSSVYRTINVSATNCTLMYLHSSGKNRCTTSVWWHDYKSLIQNVTICWMCICSSYWIIQLHEDVTVLLLTQHLSFLNIKQGHDCPHISNLTELLWTQHAPIFKRLRGFSIISDLTVKLAAKRLPYTRMYPKVSGLSRLRNKQQ